MVVNHFGDVWSCWFLAGVTVLRERDQGYAFAKCVFGAGSVVLHVSRVIVTFTSYWFQGSCIRDWMTRSHRIRAGRAGLSLCIREGVSRIREGGGLLAITIAITRPRLQRYLVSGCGLCFTSTEQRSRS